MKSTTLQSAQAYCRAYTRRHSENFSVATLFLPRRLLPPFYAVYAFCRYSDDLADEDGSGAMPTALRGHERPNMLTQSGGHDTPEFKLERLQTWRTEFLESGKTHPRHPILVALRATMERFHIPDQPFLDLLSAFEQDQTVKQYDSYGQLLDYCRRSADPVGRILLHLFECFDAQRAELSDRICTALQLANFWQDVARDFDIGRVYLPAEDRAAYGYSDEDLAARRFTPAFAELMRFEVARARELFERGLPLVDLVPSEVRIDVELFARGGLAILDRIERQNYNVWQRRPRLTKLDKAALMLRVAGRSWRERIWPRSPSQPS